MKKKVISIIMTAAMAAGMMSTSVFASDAKYDDVNLKLYIQMNDTAEAYFQSKIDEFNEADNGITVDLTNIATEADYLDKLSTDFASGETPNVFMEYGGARVLDYLEADALVNLKPYYDADEEWYNGFMSSAWEPAQFDDYGYEGLYAAPFTNYEIVLFYNQEILDANGVSVPTTWDELQAACATLKENGVQPFILGEKDDYRFGHLLTVLALKEYGPDIAQKLGNREVSYDGPEMLDLYGKIKDMVDNGYLGDNLLSTDATQENSYFTSGECAFQLQGSWRTSSIESAESDLYANKAIGVTRFPAITEEYAKVDMGGGNESFFVSQLDKSEDEINASVDLLKYITSKDFANGLMEVSPNTMAIVTDVESSNYLLNDVKAIMADTEATRSDLQNYDTQSHMLNTVRTAIQGLAMGNTPEEVGAEIIDTMSAYE